ncbi:MAG: deoxyribose-phosphate aldolase [Acidimicrobiales bacterium]
MPRCARPPPRVPTRSTSPHPGPRWPTCSAVRRSGGIASAISLIVRCIDLTTLEGDDTVGRIRALCAQARRPDVADPSVGPVAAVCVYPELVPVVAELLASTSIAVTSVAGAFPSGLSSLDARVADIADAVARGADEVDIVVNRSALLDGRIDQVRDELTAAREAAGGAHLKVILEVGELDARRITLAARLAMEAGADFVKTSTGKARVNATPARCGRWPRRLPHAAATGRRVGIKIAGGVRTADGALGYVHVVREVLGEVAHPELLRFGASSLLGAVVDDLAATRAAAPPIRRRPSIDARVNFCERPFMTDAAIPDASIPGASIPDRAEAITAEWMTAALAGSFPGVEVAGLTVLDEHHGTTGRVRFGLTYADGPAGPDSVFVKLAPPGDSQRQLVAMTDMGRKEARFYDELAAEVPMRIPAAYYAAHGERTEYIMVLEDLAAAGCTFSDRRQELSDDHAEQLITGLARVHAHFWNDPRFDAELSWLPTPMRGSLGAQLIESSRQQFEDQFPPVFGDLCRLYVDHHEGICDLWDEGPLTMIHGDCHSGNQFLDQGTVGLYDWAVICKAPGIRDISIFLGNSCPTELRRAHQEDWIELYRRTLVECGVDAPSFDELWLAYRRTVLYGWVAATTTAGMGDAWQPLEIGIAGMTRATDCCADLDTLGALRDGL